MRFGTFGTFGTFGFFANQQRLPFESLPVTLSGAKIAAILAMLLLMVAPAYAADKPEQINKSAGGPLTKAWDAYWGNRFDAATQAVEGLAKSKPSSDRWHAMHCQARAWWALGDRRAQQKAKSLWAQVARGVRDNRFAAARVQIGNALMSLERGRTTQAITVLEKIAHQQLPSIVTPEAMIELAFALAVDGQTKQALKQLDSADSFLERGESNDLPKGLQRVFQSAVKQCPRVDSDARKSGV